MTPGREVQVFWLQLAKRTSELEATIWNARINERKKWK